MKTSKITLNTIKDSDGWSDMANDLGLSEKETCEVFEYCEYGSLSIEVDENLNIIGGYIIPFKKNWRDNEKENSKY